MAQSIRQASMQGSKRAKGGAVSSSALKQLMWISLISVFCLWLVIIYDNALRDARMFDGWLLAGGMLAQIWLHIRQKVKSIPPKKFAGYRKFHIMMGFILVPIFASHMQLSLPDSLLEFVLFLCFILITLSGVFGIYLSWLAPNLINPGDSMNYSTVPKKVDELARKVRSLLKSGDQGELTAILPKTPHQDWIDDLYKNRISEFLSRPMVRMRHLVASKKQALALAEEITALQEFVDEASRQKLETVKGLVVEKDRLDYLYTNLQATKVWIYVHVPVTYSVTLLSILHVIVVYAYSTGAV